MGKLTNQQTIHRHTDQPRTALKRRNLPHTKGETNNNNRTEDWGESTLKSPGVLTNKQDAYRMLTRRPSSRISTKCLAIKAYGAGFWVSEVGNPSVHRCSYWKEYRMCQGIYIHWIQYAPVHTVTHPIISSSVPNSLTIRTHTSLKHHGTQYSGEVERNDALVGWQQHPQLHHPE